MNMIRFFDFIFSLIGLVLLSPILLVLLIIGYFDMGAPVFCQERVGKNKQPFNLYKLRSMSCTTITIFV
jgi:O-antigen biosynthesis protein WbqP